MNTTKVTFRCKASGNTVSFSSEDDIAAMRKEPEYEEIVNGMPAQQEIQREAPAEEVTQAVQPVTVVRRGRPPKVDNTVI